MDEDVFEWLAKIEGPNDSTYAGQTFDLMLHMSQDYPCSPPKVAFVTKVKHSKVNDNGAIDLEILTKEGWTGDFTVAKGMYLVWNAAGEGKRVADCLHSA